MKIRNPFVLGIVSVALLATSSFAASSTQSFVACLKGDAISIRAGKKCKSGETKVTISGIASALTTSANTVSTSLDNRFGSIPSGKTITGVIVYDGENVDTSGDYWAFQSFPAPLSVALTEDNVTVVNTTAVDNECTSATCLSAGEKTESDASGCTGTADAPTAPSGRVCIYPTIAVHVLNMFGATLAADGNGTNKYGFGVSFNTDGSAAGTDMYFRATWAYTAP